MHQLRQQGFTLIELAIVLLISGLLLGGAMSMMKPYVESAQINATKEKMNRIADALAMYEQNYGRLPCPADPSISTASTAPPYGSPRNWTAADPNGTTTDCGGGFGNGALNLYIGIVPFRAIGLDEDNIDDGYGNLLTYAVSPVLAYYTTAGGPNLDNTKVHEQCRQASWMNTSPVGNKNKIKAHFCCPNLFVTAGAGSDIKIFDSSTLATPVFTGLHESTTITPYRLQDDPSVSSPLNTNSHLIALTLVSHGQNGNGAYIPHSAATKPITAPAGAQEAENYNTTANLTFVAAPYSRTNDTNFFDDIVLWKTNDQVVSNFGNASCASP